MHGLELFSEELFLIDAVDSENETAASDSKAIKETIDFKEIKRVDHILASMQRKIDTKDILFICGGAFVDLEKTISERRQDSSIGFGAPVRANMRSGLITNAAVASSLLESVRP
ncbi:hypothetical protein M9H77_29385 [Catharanthus roseus]|uniref:Uncharacterized protein n=1 Tax=Catharanthus roseus TaxID=4058 RepID=A0ACC0AJH6_CATRO|nr:hypothetical protein M9H77_29385 [Catharanthus roseus]